MYRKLRMHSSGMCGLIWLPLFGLGTRDQVSAAQPWTEPGAENPAHSPGTGERVAPARSCHAAEMMCQRLWKPKLCAPWIFRRAHLSRSLGFDTTGTRQRQDHAIQRSPARCGMPRLFDTVTGDDWNIAKNWDAQFQPGRLILDQPPSSGQLATIMTRLLMHRKQAESTYAMLRRLPREAVRRLVVLASTHGPQIEDICWFHISNARKEEKRAHFIKKLRIKDRVCSAGSVREGIKWFLRQVCETGEGPEVTVRFQAFRGWTVARTCVNETRWQKRFANNQPPRCGCAALQQFLGHHHSCLQWTTIKGAAHAWTTWQDIMALVRPEGTEQDALCPADRLLAALGSACGVPHDGAALPIHAKTILTESNDSVAGALAQDAVRLLQHTNSGRRWVAQLGGQRCAVKHLNRFLRIEPVLRHVAGGQGSRHQVGGGVNRQLLASLLPIRWLHGATLDKAPANFRIGCPYLAWEELQAEVAKSFKQLARPSDSDTETSVARWIRDAEHILRESTDGVAVEGNDTTTARSLPKGKNPRRHRLVVSYAGFRLQELHATAARASDAVLEYVVRQSKLSRKRLEDMSVASITQVHEALHRMNELLTISCKRCQVVTVMKLDFSNFFFRVPRDSCVAALQGWIRAAQRTLGRRYYVSVQHKPRTLLQKQTNMFYNRHTPPRRYESSVLADSCRFTASPLAQEHWSTLELEVLPATLALDFQSQLCLGPDRWEQTSGVAIGSPWGTAACKLWACMVETKGEPLRRWSQRLRVPDGRRHIGGPLSHDGCTCVRRLAGMRWVDDRFWIARTQTKFHALTLVLTETLCYTEVMPTVTQALVSGLATAGFRQQMFEVSHMVLLALLIVSFFQDGLSQTLEDPSEVVGLETRFCTPTGLVVPTLGIQQFAADDLKGLVVRSSTKNRDLTGDLWTTSSLQAPRLTHDHLDPRKTHERVGSLVHWLYRLADCVSRNEFCNTCGSNRTRCLESAGSYEGTVCTEILWLSEPWRWLIREMILMAWGEGLMRDALHRTAAALRSSFHRDSQFRLAWLTLWTRWLRQVWEEELQYFQRH